MRALLFGGAVVLLAGCSVLGLLTPGSGPAKLQATDLIASGEELLVTLTGGGSTTPLALTRDGGQTWRIMRAPATAETAGWDASGFYVSTTDHEAPGMPVRAIQRWVGSGWVNVTAGLTGVAWQLFNVGDRLYALGDRAQVFRREGEGWTSLGARVADQTDKQDASAQGVFTDGRKLYCMMLLNGKFLPDLTQEQSRANYGPTRIHVFDPAAASPVWEPVGVEFPPTAHREGPLAVEDGQVFMEGVFARWTMPMASGSWTQEKKAAKVNFDEWEIFYRGKAGLYHTRRNRLELYQGGTWVDQGAMPATGWTRYSMAELQGQWYVIEGGKLYRRPVAVPDAAWVPVPVPEQLDG